MVKDRLSPIVHWLRTNADVPDRHNQPWFKSYTEVWKKVSTAYSIAKQLTESTYRDDPKKRRKLQESLSFEVTTALDAFDKFVEEFQNG